jgi:hypothetical protein
MAVICKKCHWGALLCLRKSFNRHLSAFYVIVIEFIVTKVTVYVLCVLFYLVHKNLNTSAYIQIQCDVINPKVMFYAYFHIWFDTVQRVTKLILHVVVTSLYAAKLGLIWLFGITVV